MRSAKTLGVIVLQLVLGYVPSAAAQCGDYDACIGTEYCATQTFTTPYSTVVTTCVPTPTCLTVYEGCVSGGGGPGCCSGYCAATKCRSTDPNWPNCSEDLGLCLEDENCCYGNSCVDGLCVRPSATPPPSGCAAS